MKNTNGIHGRSDFEYLEYGLASIFTVVLTVADLFFVWLSSDDHGHPAKIVHEVFRGFLLSLVASSCLTMLIRWYRHRDEILVSVDNFKALNQYSDVAECIKKITISTLDIRQKDWPPPANELLVEALQKLKSVLDRLNAGKIELNFDESSHRSPKFFLATTGLSFVTDYGDLDYWKSDRGRKQLESNKVVLRDRPNSIIRMFILPPYEHASGNRVQNLDDVIHDLDVIIKEQLEAGVDVRVIPEKKLDRRFLRDVAIFFRDAQGRDIQFASEWELPGRGIRKAYLYFDGEELKECKRMYGALIEDGRAKRITSFSDWEEYKVWLNSEITTDSPKKHEKRVAGTTLPR